MKRIFRLLPTCFIPLALFCSLTVLSQDKNFFVRGVVRDEKSGQALAGASVFCQNTTIGAVSDNEGHFALRLPNGGYDLIISYTGYETQSIRISKGNAVNDSMNVVLKEQDKTMSETVVVGSTEVADGWSKYGQFFLDNFIGTTPNAGQCMLENKEVLHFYFYKKRNKLRVKATDVLVVDNNALGYKIRYQLDSFVYDYNGNVGSYTGYPLFEALQGTPEQQDTWKQNRLYAYSGSRLHFIRSWYDSTLDDEGFVVELADSITGNFKRIDNPYDPGFYSRDSGDVEIDIQGRLRVS